MAAGPTQTTRTATTGVTAGVTRRTFVGRTAAAVGAAGLLGEALGPSVAQAGVSAQAKITGKLQVVQVQDFHPDHNAFLKKSITDYAAQQGWALDLSDLAGFLGSTDIYQKLQAQKAAGQPVDLIFHGLSARLLTLYDLVQDAKPLVDRAVQRYGKPYSSARAGAVVDGKWVGLPFYDRTGGYFVRDDKFAEVGMSRVAGSFDTWDNIRDACRAVSNPSQNFYGWGMTVNRSGDGESLVWSIIHAWGGALADESGQIVTLFSPETIDSMTWLADLYTNPANGAMIPPGVNAWNDLSNNEAWLAGTLGFTSNAGTLYAKSVFDKTTTPDGQLLADVTSLIPQPLGPFGIRLQGSGGHYFYFMKGAKNFDAAAQLAEFHLTADVQRQLWQISDGYVVPAYERMWDDPIVANNRISQSFKPVSFNEPPFQGNAYRGPLSEAADAVDQQNVATDMFGEILAGKNVIAAVRDAHLRCVDIYKSFGYKGR